MKLLLLTLLIGLLATVILCQTPIDNLLDTLDVLREREQGVLDRVTTEKKQITEQIQKIEGYVLEHSKSRLLLQAEVTLFLVIRSKTAAHTRHHHRLMSLKR